MHRDVPGSAVLFNALSARGLSPVVVNDEPGAMVALAELLRRGVARCVLIVVDPSRWERLKDLSGAVRTHHGSVYCWQFDVREGAEPRLSVLDAGVGGSGEAESSVVGKIRHRRRSVDDLLVQAPGRELTTREVVTQQELTMLLGPAPGEAG
eukprot:g14104.t1